MGPLDQDQFDSIDFTRTASTHKNTMLPWSQYNAPPQIPDNNPTTLASGQQLSQQMQQVPHHAQPLPSGIFPSTLQPQMPFNYAQIPMPAKNPTNTRTKPQNSRKGLIPTPRRVRWSDAQPNSNVPSGSTGTPTTFNALNPTFQQQYIGASPTSQDYPYLQQMLMAQGQEAQYQTMLHQQHLQQLLQSQQNQTQPVQPQLAQGQQPPDSTQAFQQQLYGQTNAANRTQTSNQQAYSYSDPNSGSPINGSLYQHMPSSTSNVSQDPMKEALLVQAQTLQTFAEDLRNRAQQIPGPSVPQTIQTSPSFSQEPTGFSGVNPSNSMFQTQQVSPWPNSNSDNSSYAPSSQSTMFENYYAARKSLPSNFQPSSVLPRGVYGFQPPQ